MTKIKSFSTNNGDMFYIKHGSDNFTIIDCCIDDEKKKDIIQELKKESENKKITRMISTHPDDDHIRGLKYLTDNFSLPNFYCVKNETTKSEPTDDFKKYCELHDSEKAFYLYKGCSRKYMNDGDEQIGSSGINIKWPDTSNKYFKDALDEAKKGNNPNNISPIITYSLNKGINAYWFGDLETDYMNNIKDNIKWIKADVVFAAHHGRSSGRIPNEILEKIEPKVIIIGEAPSENLDYYNGYETITQNTAKDIVIICGDGYSDFFVSNTDYNTGPKNLKYITGKYLRGYKYIGSIEHDK